MMMMISIYIYTFIFIFILHDLKDPMGMILFLIHMGNAGFISSTSSAVSFALILIRAGQQGLRNKRVPLEAVAAA